MEVGNCDPPTEEFEFEILSDVGVAAFEDVAAEVTVNSSQDQQTLHQSAQHQEQNTNLQPLLQSPQLPPQHHDLQSSIRLSTSTSTSQQQHQQTRQQPQQTTQQHQTQLHQQQQHHHVTSLPSGTPGKILLLPINSKPGTPGIKQLYQLQSSPLTMGQLTSGTGNKKQMIQFTTLAASEITAAMTKNNYHFPVNSSHILPGSSQAHVKQQNQQPTQLYLATSTTPSSTNITTTLTRISSPGKNQNNLGLNAIFNHHQSNLHNNGSNMSSSNVATANLSQSRNNSYHHDSLRVSTPNSNAANDVPKKKPCNCTKSQCLKLYCDCFANGEFCSGCNCTNCFNSLSKEKERQQAITQCLERNPEAFRPKIGKAVKQSLGEPTPESIERRHTKGCNCKRSGCLKNYCECYEAKILCSNLCKCCGCKNYEESFERKSLMQLTNATSDNARGILKNLLPTNSGHSTGKDFSKSFITDKVINASLVCLLQSAQQAEKDGTPTSNIPNLIQSEMGKCLRMIVDSAAETTDAKKR